MKRLFEPIFEFVSAFPVCGIYSAPVLQVRGQLVWVWRVATMGGADEILSKPADTRSALWDLPRPAEIIPMESIFMV